MNPIWEKDTNQSKWKFIIVGLFLLFSGFFFFRLSSSSQLNKLSPQKTIVLAGDSRSSSDYSFYQELLEGKTGYTVHVQGASGRNAAYNASNEYFERIKGNDHDYSIWLVGGNDDGHIGSVGTFRTDSILSEWNEPVVLETDIKQDYQGNTFIQAIDHIMRKYRELYSGKSEDKKPLMIFCTDLPQQRENANTEWSKKENWERKRLAILECCEKNEIICLDLYELCHFDMSQEPFFVPPTDKLNNYGKYFMDGLHPNKMGMDIITDFEAQLINSYE